MTSGQLKHLQCLHAAPGIILGLFVQWESAAAGEIPFPGSDPPLLLTADPTAPPQLCSRGFLRQTRPSSLPNRPSWLKTRTGRIPREWEQTGHWPGRRQGGITPVTTPKTLPGLEMQQLPLSALSITTGSLNTAQLFDLFFFYSALKRNTIKMQFWLLLLKHD